MLELPEQRVERAGETDEDACELAERASSEQVGIRQTPEKQADADEYSEVDADATEDRKGLDSLPQARAQHLTLRIFVLLLVHLTPPFILSCTLQIR